MNRLTFAFASLLLAHTALGAGFYFGDNGTKNLIQGGAFAAQADDLTAMQHNPAGLAYQEGWTALLDTQFMNHEVSFSRQDPGFDPAAPSTLVQTVTNKGGIFFIPFVAVGKGFSLLERRFAVSVGVYTPPSVGRYEFATPNYTKDDKGKYLENPVKYAPTRYGLIKNNVIVAYPTLTLSGEVIPNRFSLGVSLQAVYSGFTFEQALYSGLFTPAKQTLEQPEFDSIVTVNVIGQWAFTGVIGAMVKPTDKLSFGASFRPAIPIKASGTLDIALGETPKMLSTVQGNHTDFYLTLPAELRVGARFTPIEKLGINADFVYQGWDSLQSIGLVPTDVYTKIGTADAVKVDPLTVVKKWKPSYSVRVGGSYDIIDLVTVHAGFFYETGTSKPEYYTLDFAHPDRVFITGGASLHLPYFDVVGGVAYTPNVNTAIQTSEVRQGQTDVAVPGNVIATGIYNTSGYVLTLGVRFHSLDSKKAPKSGAVSTVDAAGPAAVTPAPVPAAQTCPADAPCEKPAVAPVEAK